MQSHLTSIELCAGGGGQALGLESAGFGHEALVEIDDWSRKTLKLNRPQWNVIEGSQSDLTQFDASPYRGVDLVAGGVPCPPFSVAGKQLGPADERDLFPEAIRVVDQVRPKAVMLENVRGFLDAVFSDYRHKLRDQLRLLGYSRVEWALLNASDYGVPQLRPRVVIIAVQDAYADNFSWPNRSLARPKTVGQTLHDLMSSNNWPGSDAWSEQADEIAPTVVGGSKKHGGPDLGPTRARKAWASLGVNGSTIADDAPAPDFVGMPRLTVRMVARLQGFPDSWSFAGRKTAAYRQVGNAFPPPVAQAVAQNLRAAITTRRLFAVA
ncbi:MAG: DNA (cytosine-5-)-methyltransferase [Tabrizicola sp.]|uniref:DNA cytosine methyltransferase n=1 Tax=Tabrizicola sp. TaxID=2005166 RepID=UPI0027323F28|nr:DNA (cytosine-5-)-methyltransferase [Tabrizicola sp.]MDP3262027.1 DNA (cytosine-5-)-methyltransferase [Tabrizicola sp.]MDZ4089314.1 DNA (cytosine-5-)-methyltransferase [Tabrizicola sp.]